MPAISFFECSKCGATLPPDRPQTLCPKDGGSLYVRYDLNPLRRESLAQTFAAGPKSMWRYAAVLPNVEPVTLGEGFTPMLPSLRSQNVWIKDEGVNPTGSFKARGLCLAVTMAKHYGLKKLAIPSAGNAAGALAAYCAAAKIEAHIFMPKDVPVANLVECRAYGANVNLVDGLISDCAKQVAAKKESEGWFDISTLKEPFRVEGKKTMGYEIAEQLGWKLPDAVFYPTGGGVGLIGMWKAFDEMEQLGLIGTKRPKMIAVQASGCAPIPKAFDEGKPASEMWHSAETLASGLRVPKAYGDYIVLDVVKRSGGTAIAVTDREIIDAVLEWSREEALFASPEGAASLAAYKKLLSNGFLREDESIVLFNTGLGLKYVDVMAKAMGISAGNGAVAQPESKLPATRNLGGIIQPY